MGKLPRKSSSTLVDFAVDNNSQSDAPTDKNAQYMLCILDSSKLVFGKCHGSRIILQKYGLQEPAFEVLLQTFFAKIEVGMVYPSLGINQSWHGNTDGNDFVRRDG